MKRDPDVICHTGGEAGDELSSDQQHQSQLLCLKETTGKSWPEWIAFVAEKYPEHEIMSLKRFQNTAQQEQALQDAGCDLSLATGFVRYAAYFLEQQDGAKQQYGIVRGSTDSTPMRTKLVNHFVSGGSFNVGGSEWMLENFSTTPTTQAFNQLFLFKEGRGNRHYNANKVDFLPFTREPNGARVGMHGIQDEAIHGSALPPVIDPYGGQIAENETEQALLSILIPRFYSLTSICGR